MKLIGSLTSPFVRKVRVALIEKNLPYEFVIDVPWNADTHVPDYNPLGKVPTLIGDDGSVWFDSNMLLEYLEANYPETQLIPRDRQQALTVWQSITLADGIADAAVAIFLEKKRSPQKQDDDWIVRQNGKIMRGLMALEREAHNKIWLHDIFGAADIAAGCMLLWLDFRLPQLEWRTSFPALNALSERLSTRASFLQTVPVG